MFHNIKQNMKILNILNHFDCVHDLQWAFFCQLKPNKCTMISNSISTGQVQNMRLVLYSNKDKVTISKSGLRI